MEHRLHNIRLHRPHRREYSPPPHPSALPPRPRRRASRHHGRRRLLLLLHRRALLGAHAAHPPQHDDDRGDGLRAHEGERARGVVSRVRLHTISCQVDDEGAVERGVGEAGEGGKPVVVGVEEGELGVGHGREQARVVLYVPAPLLLSRARCLPSCLLLGLCSTSARWPHPRRRPLLRPQSAFLTRGPVAPAEGVASRTSVTPSPLFFYFLCSLCSRSTVVLFMWGWLARTFFLPQGPEDLCARAGSSGRTPTSEGSADAKTSNSRRSASSRTTSKRPSSIACPARDTVLAAHRFPRRPPHTRPRAPPAPPDPAPNPQETRSGGKPPIEIIRAPSQPGAPQPTRMQKAKEVDDHHGEAAAPIWTSGSRS